MDSLRKLIREDVKNGSLYIGSLNRIDFLVYLSMYSIDGNIIHIIDVVFFDTALSQEFVTINNPNDLITIVDFSMLPEGPHGRKTLLLRYDDENDQKLCELYFSQISYHHRRLEMHGLKP